MNIFLYILTFFFLTTTGVVGTDETDLLIVGDGKKTFSYIPESGSVIRAIETFAEKPFSYERRESFIPEALPRESNQQSDTVNEQEEQEAEPAPTPVEVIPPRPSLTEAIASGAENLVDSIFKNSSEGTISSQGIFSATNLERANRGLPVFTANQELTAMAEEKLEDMFDKQYFEHVSPVGTTIQDLAEHAGYAYLMIGENLAVGSFTDAAHIVQAWMDSPGHRANILSSHYSELGIAIRRGEYEGRVVWMAVQEFGLPRNVCPSPSESQVAHIEQQNEEIHQLQMELDSLRNQLEGMTPSNSSYASLVEKFNATVVVYNATITEQKEEVTNYNQSVRAYNECVATKTN